MAVRRLVLVTTLGLVGCHACTQKAPPPARPPLFISVDASVYPNGSTLRVEFSLRNANGDVRVSVGDGGVFGPAIPTDGGQFTVDLPTGISEGVFPLRATDPTGSTAVVPVSVAEEGIFEWSVTRPDDAMQQCVGPFQRADGGLVVVSFGGGVDVIHQAAAKGATNLRGSATPHLLPGRRRESRIRRVPW